MSNKVKVKAIGGVGQIGSNMTMIDHNGQKIIIDAGILFPYEDFFDIDYLIPDLSKIDTPDILLITHGHEDHIGAVFNCIRFFPDIKIYAPKLAAALIRKKLEFNKISHPIIEIEYNKSIELNDIKIDYVQVNHSIPDTHGIYFSFESLGTGMFFVSDFKIDSKTKLEPYFDFKKLKQISTHHNRRILFADSTNISSSTLSTPSEEDIVPVLEEIISKAESRIFITMFSSNIHRMTNILSLAEKYQFKVVPYGRSMHNYINIATECKLMPDFSKVIVQSETIKKDQENIIVLLSGCQGDFLGSFRRVALKEDSLFKPKATDTFVISSKAIPGNEKKISLLLNSIAAIGSKIYSPANCHIHVSGHPGKNDLTKLYLEFDPTHIIPIHGETYLLREHVEHAKTAFPKAQTYFLQNFDTIEFDLNSLKLIESEKFDPLIYHGKHILLERDKISERRKLATTGCAILSLKLNYLHQYDKHEMKLIGLPNEIHNNIDHFNTFLDNEIKRSKFKDKDKAAEELRISIRRYFDAKIGYKPTTVVQVL